MDLVQHGEPLSDSISLSMGQPNDSRMLLILEVFLYLLSTKWAACWCTASTLLMFLSVAVPDRRGILQH